MTKHAYITLHRTPSGILQSAVVPNKQLHREAESSETGCMCVHVFALWCLHLSIVILQYRRMTVHVGHGMSVNVFTFSVCIVFMKIIIITFLSFKTEGEASSNSQFQVLCVRKKGTEHSEEESIIN